MIGGLLEEYHKGNPVAQAIRRRLPEGYLNRWVFIGTMLLILLASWAYLEQQEPRVECKSVYGCVHPFTGEPLPLGYEEGRPLALQAFDLFVMGFFVMVTGVLLNHAVFMWRSG